VSHSRRTGHAPVAFDDDAFGEDLKRASESGAEIAETTRARYERDGVPADRLRKCEAEGSDGTSLPRCLKVYLPTPAGPFGMVFQLVARQGSLRLRYLAFGCATTPTDRTRSPSTRSPTSDYMTPGQTSSKRNQKLPDRD
jgi:hypothetical protein